MNINSTQLLFSKEYMHISLDQINENAEFGWMKSWNLRAGNEPHISKQLEFNRPPERASILTSKRNNSRYHHILYPGLTSISRSLDCIQ
jgi:hypothetical protein